MNPAAGDAGGRVGFVNYSGRLDRVGRADRQGVDRERTQRTAGLALGLLPLLLLLLLLLAVLVGLGRTRGVGLVLLGHYASERFAVEELAGVIGERFADLEVFASRDERDPVQRF